MLDEPPHTVETKPSSFLAVEAADPLFAVPEPSYTQLELKDLQKTAPWVSKARLMAGRIALAIAAIAFWEYVSVSQDLKFWIGSPSGVVETMTEWWSTPGFLWLHISTTLQSMVFGLVFGSLVGIALGLLLGLIRPLGRLLDPFIMAINSLPKIALAPMFVLWFGIGIQMRTILVATICFFLVFINTYAGVLDRNQELIEVMQVMGAQRRHLIMKLVIPGSLSYIVIGLKLAIPYALTGAVFAEIIASNRGIGYLLMRAAGQFDTSGLFAALGILMLLAVLLNAGLNRGSDRFLRWKIAGAQS